MTVWVVQHYSSSNGHPLLFQQVCATEEVAKQYVARQEDPQNYVIIEARLVS